MAELDKVEIKEIKKGKKYEVVIPGFDKDKQTFSAEVSSDLRKAYESLDFEGQKKHPLLLRAFHKLTGHKHRMDGKLDSGEQLNALALFTNSEATTGKAGRRIEIYQSMAKVLDKIDYTNSDQVKLAGQMLANNDKWRDSVIIGAAISKLDNPEHVAKLLVAMGEDKRGNYRGTSVLAYALNGKNFSQEPDTAKNKADRVSPEQEEQNKTFIKEVLKVVRKELGSDEKLAKFLEAHKGRGSWQVSKRGSVFSDFENIAREIV